MTFQELLLALPQPFFGPLLFGDVHAHPDQPGDFSVIVVQWSLDKVPPSDVPRSMGKTPLGNDHPFAPFQHSTVGTGDLPQLLLGSHLQFDRFLAQQGLRFDPKIGAEGSVRHDVAPRGVFDIKGNRGVVENRLEQTLAAPKLRLGLPGLGNVPEKNGENLACRLFCF